MDERRSPADDRLLEVVQRVFDDKDIDWDTTQTGAETADELTDLRSLYELWQIYEFNRLVMEGDDPTKVFGPGS